MGQRLFRLDRITSLEMTSETFPPRVHFPALEAVQQALASVPRVWQVGVWLETTLVEVQRQTRLPKAFFHAKDLLNASFSENGPRMLREAIGNLLTSLCLE